jgi:hypothetical protein
MPGACLKPVIKLSPDLFEAVSSLELDNPPGCLSQDLSGIHGRTSPRNDLMIIYYKLIHRSTMTSDTDRGQKRRRVASVECRHARERLMQVDQIELVPGQYVLVLASERVRKACTPHDFNPDLKSIAVGSGPSWAGGA